VPTTTPAAANSASSALVLVLVALDVAAAAERGAAEDDGSKGAGDDAPAVAVAGMVASTAADHDTRSQPRARTSHAGCDTKVGGQQ